MINRPHARGSYRGFGGAPGPTRPRDLAIEALANAGRMDIAEAERQFEHQVQEEATYQRARPEWMRSRSSLFDPLALGIGESLAVEKGGAPMRVRASESQLLAPPQPALHEQYGFEEDPYTLGYGDEQRRNILQGLVNAAKRRSTTRIMR